MPVKAPGADPGMLTAVTAPTPLPPHPATPLPVRVVPSSRPLDWLHAGLQDMARTTSLSLLHGALFSVGALIILVAGWRHFGILAGAFTGFLLVAPAGAVGLYELSRQLARGRQPGPSDIWQAWHRGGRGSIQFGLLLAAIGTAWVLFSALVLVGMSGQPGSGLRGFVSAAVLRTADAPERGYLFGMWLMAGGLLAAWVFAVSAVAIPLMLDRPVSLRTAMLTSARAVGANPVAMALWAMTILVLTLVGIVTLIGLAVLLPLLGHATWHAYQDLVDTSGLPERD